MSFLALSILAVAFAGLHFSEGKPLNAYIDVESFDVGMAAVAIYLAPAAGDERVSVDLKDASGHILLHMNYREAVNLMVLNTKIGSWGYEFHCQLDLTPGETVTLIAKAENDRFNIYVNGEYLCTLLYRTDVTDVKRMEYTATPNSGSELKSLQFYY